MNRLLDEWLERRMALALRLAKDEEGVRRVELLAIAETYQKVMLKILAEEQARQAVYEDESDL